MSATLNLTSIVHVTFGVRDLMAVFHLSSFYWLVENNMCSDPIDGRQDRTNIRQR